MKVTRNRRLKLGVTDKDDLGKSIPLDFGRHCGPELACFINWCTGHVLDYHRIKSPRKSSIEKLDDAANLLIANLIQAHRTSPKCFVAMSLSPNEYSAKDNRYRRRPISYENLNRVIDWLCAPQEPLVDFARGFSDARKAVRTGRLSRIRATDRLIATLRRYQTIISRPANCVNLRALDTVRSPKSLGRTTLPTSWTNFKPTSDTIRLKGETKKRLIAYNDSDETISMRNKLDQWNTFLTDHHHVDLLLMDPEIESIFSQTEAHSEDEVHSAFGDETDRPKFVELDRVRLHRVFNNGSFEKGGRFYGAWWQRVPSRFRRYITINDKPTKEFDFSNLHPAILYAREGKQLAEDAYHIPDLENYRKLIKTTMLKLINAKENQPIRAPNKDALPPNLSWNELQHLVKEKHVAIAKYFRSGVGLELQKLDAQIAEDVMLAMMKRDYLALPIHDSFIVHSGLEKMITEEMKHSYRSHMKAEVGVDADPTFLELEIQGGAKLEGDEIPSILEIMEMRSNEPGYEGYQARIDTFVRSKDAAWERRFGAGRGY